jgi:hypothetical protein
MRYAQIKDCIIQNVIELDDDTQVSLFEDGFDYCIRVDQLDPQPSIGWFYDGDQFTDVIQQDVLGGIPSDVPHGDQTSFDPFHFSDSSGCYDVSLDDQTLNIGCHQYDYTWTRYALWMILENGQSQMGPLIKTQTGVSYGSFFNVVMSDIMNLYSALCTVK